MQQQATNDTNVNNFRTFKSHSVSIWLFIRVGEEYVHSLSNSASHPSSIAFETKSIETCIWETDGYSGRSSPSSPAPCLLRGIASPSQPQNLPCVFHYNANSPVIPETVIQSPQRGGGAASPYALPASYLLGRFTLAQSVGLVYLLEWDIWRLF